MISSTPDSMYQAFPETSIIAQKLLYELISYCAKEEHAIMVLSALPQQWYGNQVPVR